MRTRIILMSFFFQSTQVTSLLKDAGITNLVVQVEKETYFTHMTGLGASVDSAFQTTQNLHTLTYQTNYSHL